MFRIIFLLTILMSSVALAQNANIQKSEAVIIDEFGPLGHCDMGARLDNFLVTLMEQPNAKGYIIFYEGKDALPSRIEKSFGEILYMNYIRTRSFDLSRITLITSYRDEMATELWIVPENAAPPQPRDYIPKPEISLDKTLLYDRSALDLYDDLDLLLPHKKAELEEPFKGDEEISEETTVEPISQETKLTAEELEDLKFHWTSKEFGEFLEKNKKMQGVIMFYADDQEFDVNKVTSRLEEGKRRIAKAANIAPERMQIIFGGYKSYVQIEFWAVPEKGKFPEAQPEERIIEVENEMENEIESL